MQIWKCTTDESNRIVHDFFESQHFAAGILPIPGKSLIVPGCLKSINRAALSEPMCSPHTFDTRLHSNRGTGTHYHFTIPTFYSPALKYCYCFL